VHAEGPGVKGPTRQDNMSVSNELLADTRDEESFRVQEVAAAE